MFLKAKYAQIRNHLILYLFLEVEKHIWILLVQFGLQNTIKSYQTQQRCDGSDGKADDSGLKSPGFNPMQEK